MSGLTLSQQMKWRKELEYSIRSKFDGYITFIHPPMFFSTDSDANEKEAMEWDISQLTDSDIVVVDLSTVSDSIGTHIEIGIVDAINRCGNKHIHLIGIGETDTDHPWIQMSMLKCLSTIEEAAEYISTYLLI